MMPSVSTGGFRRRAVTLPLAGQFFFTLSVSFIAAAGLELFVTFPPDSSFAYYQVEDAATNETIFSSGRIAAFVDGSWCVALDAEEERQQREGLLGISLDGASPLALVGNENIHGYDETLGEYTGVALHWTCQHDHDRLRSDPVPVKTTVKNFDSGSDVLFEVEFLEGAPGTSSATLEPNVSTPEGSMMNFPALTLASESLLPNVLSWEGTFIRKIEGRSSRGARGGPIVFYGKNVVVGSPWGGNWKAFTAGQGTDWSGKPGYWAPGISGRITSLPAGFRQAILLHASDADVGITQALAEWGEIMQQSRPSKGRKVQDLTLTKVGYQTDNGAYYCFCKEKNCSQTLIDTLGVLNSMEVPMGYLSFQGSGASSGGRSAAPWCVDKWGVDGGLGPMYPMPLADFQRALDIPLQLYAPYFCPQSPYFHNDNDQTHWTSVVSDRSLPGCDSYAFQDVSPSQSRAFYDWFFEKGKAIGMISYEPDFMNQNFNCVRDFVESATAATQWQTGMADAAAEKGVALQWCMATPTDVLAALDMPAVTNFRVSTDFCYGESWDIGVSSLLVWALGMKPSKDTLWTSENHRLAIPGCPWTPDHELPAAELHVVLAVMSGGPVGISDAVGMTNSTLLKRAIRRDGTLLQPSKPLTAVDSSLPSSGCGGYVYGTYTSGASTAPPSWIFVSFKLPKPYPVLSSDLYPRLSMPDAVVPTLLAIGRFTQRRACVDGSDALESGCLDSIITVKGTDRFVLFDAPASSMKNVTGGTDLAPEITTVWQSCSEKWIFLGELSKYVSLSPGRFSRIACNSEGITTRIKGSAGEAVQITALALDKATRYKVVKQNVTLPGRGFATVMFRNGDGSAGVMINDH